MAEAKSNYWAAWTLIVDQFGCFKREGMAIELLGPLLSIYLDVLKRMGIAEAEVGFAEPNLPITINVVNDSW